ncbi:MAG: shikimate kinase [Luteitalea sp.]|nr:shikimate kinase [Luteitalea sp.]
MVDKIYLVGFMAAGKTTVARLLARRLSWRMVDLDALIEARERSSVADIFAKSGEPYFRRIESDVLRALLPERHTVVAAGGGTYSLPANRLAMNADGLVIWLDAPLDEITARLPTDGSRPLVQTRAQLEQLYLARRALYADAHIQLDTRGKAAEELVEWLLDHLDL